MPVHDWTRVDAGVFHAFHTGWTFLLQDALNGGLLPPGYYALAEQHAGRVLADVLTLHASPALPEPLPLPPATGGVLLAEAPPRVRRHQVIQESALARRRSLAIRHVSGHRLIALVELISPSNNDRAASIGEFADKVLSALERGVHVLMVDLFLPTRHDPQGLHGVIVQRLHDLDQPYDLPADEPFTLAAYMAAPNVEAFLEHVAVGASLPDMPLFIRPDRYVNVPLETTYQTAYRAMPAIWREVLEGRD